MVKQVKFTDAEPKLHHFDPYNGYGAPTDDTGSSNGGGGGDGQRPSQLTEEMTLLSTLHGRARRQLRDISKHDLKTVIKYGTKTTGRTVNGERRWMFEHGNTVVITDYYCQKEVTSYNKAIEIERATITQQMMDNHNEAVRLMRDDPHMCATHSIIIIDQSASMKTCDVNCFRSRSDASYGTLALDYIAQQLYQMADEISMDAVTIIEMHDEGTVFVDKEPLDWILFNKVLDRPSTSKPRSHGNYVKSLEVAQDIINSECELFAELDADDIPAFSLVLISDGKPSDTLPEHEEMRLNIVTCIAKMLKSKLIVCGMGIGACGSDFEQLKMLVDKAIEHGSEGQFNHAGLNPANLSTTFSSIATSMTTKRNDLCSITGEKLNKTEKSYQMRQKKQVNVEYAMQKETSLVRRSVYDHKNDDWKEVDFLNHDSGGFAIEKNPFGKVSYSSVLFFFTKSPFSLLYLFDRGQNDWRICSKK